MRFVIPILLILCLPAAATAENFQSSWYLYADGSVAIPSSPGTFNHLWKTGFGGGLGVGLQVSPWAAVTLRADANFFSLDSDAFAEANGWDEASGGTFSVAHAWLGGRAHTTYPDPEVRFRPYLLGGVGVIRTRTNRIDYVLGATKDGIVSETEIAFAVSAGFGTDLQITDRLAACVDVQAVLGLTRDEDTVYFPFRLGISYMLGAGPYI